MSSSLERVGAEHAETLRRVRVALAGLGVADCDDPIAALEALAEDTPRREAGALDERNAAVLRARSELVAERAEVERLGSVLRHVAAERDRLQRACDEGLPREVILCPACKKPHVEGPRHDDPAKDGRTRPHHHHRCYLCGHDWESGRWTFGVAAGEENEVTRRLRAEGRAAGLREALEIVRASNREAYALHRKDTADATAGTLAAWTDEMVRDVAALLPDDAPQVGVSRG